MLFEKAIILTNARLPQELVDTEKCGLIHQEKNAKDLAEKILYLYNHPAQRKRMGQNGKKAVLEKYNLENASKDLIQMYKKIEKQSYLSSN